MFCAGMFGALKPDFEACMATLKLVMNVVGEFLSRKEQLRHRAVFLATARRSCPIISNSKFMARLSDWMGATAGLGGHGRIATPWIRHWR